MLKQAYLPDDEGFNVFYPGSVILVSAVDADGKVDICTVGAWSIVNGRPRMYGIAMCARSAGDYFWKRYTTTCIEQTGEFVINVPHSDMAEAWKTCGTVSLTEQPNVDKFKLAGLTPQPATRVRAPLIAECPINIECVVKERVELGTHDWIIGQPVACHVAKELEDGKKQLHWSPAVVMK